MYLDWSNNPRVSEVRLDPYSSIVVFKLNSFGVYDIFDVFLTVFDIFDVFLTFFDVFWTFSTFSMFSTLSVFRRDTDRYTSVTSGVFDPINRD